MRKKKLFMFLVSMVMTMFAPTAQAQTIEELQAAIDRGSLTRAGSVDEVDLSPYSSLELDGTLYIRSGQRKRFVNGSLKAKSSYNGALVTVQAGGYLELPSGVTMTGDYSLTHPKGLVNVTGGELKITGASLEVGTPVSSRGVVVSSPSNNSSISSYSTIFMESGHVYGQIGLNNKKDYLKLSGGSASFITTQEQDVTIILTSSFSSAVGFASYSSRMAYLNILFQIHNSITIHSGQASVYEGDIIAKGYDGYQLTENDLKKVKFSPKESDGEWETYLEDNCIKVRKATSFDLQAELDKVAAAGTYTYEKPTTITIPAKGVVIDKEIIVNSKCHATLTGGPIIISNTLNEASHDIFRLSGSIHLKNIVFDCNNNKNNIFSYYFTGSGKLYVDRDVKFKNNSIDNTVALFYMFKDAELEYYPKESVFKSSLPVIEANNESTIKMYGSIESGSTAINAPLSNVTVIWGTVASAGDYVIRCKDITVTETGTTIKSLREDASSVVLIESETAKYITGEYIGEGSRIIVKNEAMTYGYVPLPTLRLEKDAVLTVEKGTKYNITLSGDWQDFTIGKNVVYCDVADTAKINFLKPWPSGAYPTYYKSEGAFCFADLQWIIDHPLNNTGEDDEPVNIAVPCDGLNTQKDISLAGLQALIDGSPTEECGEPIPIKIHPLCTSCSTTPPTIIVKPWKCGGDVEIPEGSCISLTNIYVDGLGGTKRIYVYGTLIIDINVYIRNFGGCAIHVRPGGHVIYRGNGGGATGFIYNEGGRVTIEQGEMGGGSGFSVVNIDGTVEIFCGCKDTETPTKIYGGIQNGNANGGGGTIHIYGGDIYEGGIVNHGTIYIHGGTFHSPGGRPTIENHGEIHLDGGLVDGDIYTYNDLHLCGCASVTDIYLRGGKTIYITERLQIKLRIHVFIQGTFGDSSCITIGMGGYVLTEEDLKLIEIILPDGYEWEYDNERHAILVKQTTGIRDIECDGNTAAPVYTLKGQKAGTTAEGENIGEGIYIINGKKRVVKRPEM